MICDILRLPITNPTMTSTLEAPLGSYPVGKVELGPRKAVEMSQNTKDL